MKARLTGPPPLSANTPQNMSEVRIVAAQLPEDGLFQKRSLTCIDSTNLYYVCIEILLYLTVLNTNGCMIQACFYSLSKPRSSRQLHSQ